MKPLNAKIFTGICLLASTSVWYVYQGPITPANASIPAPSDKASRPRGSDAPVTVNVVSARKQDVPVELQASGTVVALNTVELRPQTTSLLKGVHIKEGQFVRAGDLLFTLDDRNDRANLDKANAQLARDQASLSDLERQYKRSLDLVAQKFISQGASDTLQTQVEAQQALLKSDQAAVQLAKIAISNGSILAPMAGRVGAINVTSGSLVQPSSTLASLTQINPISVSFSVPEANLQSLLEAKRHGAVVVKVSRANTDKTLDGKLSFIDNAVDPVAGTIRVKAEFDNSNTDLWPGQYVNTKIAVSTLKEAVVVPLAALVTATKGRLVYAMQEDKTAKPYPVELLYNFGASAVVSGLRGGEKIIVEGKQNLRTGSKVQEASTLADAGKEAGKKRSRKEANGTQGSAL
jgi:RND family efflux transporter MFP subunit